MYGPDLHAAVHAAVDAADPQGLLAMGCPADEYDPEIPDLAALVRAGRVTPDGVLAVWERWFGPGSALAHDPERLRLLTAALDALRDADGPARPR